MNRAQKLNRQIVKKTSGTIPGPEFRIPCVAAIDSAAAFAGQNRLRNVPSADVGISPLPGFRSNHSKNRNPTGERNASFLFFQIEKRGLSSLHFQLDDGSGLPFFSASHGAV